MASVPTKTKAQLDSNPEIQFGKQTYMRPYESHIVTT